LLLEQSPAAPELPGLSELIGTTICFRDLAVALPHKLKAFFTNRWLADNLSDSICEAAKRIDKAKYSARSWTERR
jgi:hypothetical protein